MAGRVVGHPVLPRPPDHAAPGAGQDPLGVRVGRAPRPRSCVEVGGPGVGVPAVAGEVDEGIAQPLVGRPSEGDGAVLARRARRGCRPGQAGQGLGGGNALGAVADLGQQVGGAHRARARQAREDLPVGLGDPGLEGRDLLAHAHEHGHQRVAHRPAGAAPLSDRARRGIGQPSVELARRAAPAVAAGLQPARQAQRERCGRVGRESPQPSAVGAKDIGKDMGGQGIVLVAGRAVALAQRLHLAGGDHHHLQARPHQGVDHRPVGALDRHPPDPRAAKPPAHGGQIRPRVAHTEALDRRASPRIRHHRLLAVGPVGKHPVCSGHVCRSLTDRRSGALRSIASRHVLGHRPSQSSRRRSGRKRRGRWTGGHQGCAASCTASGTRMVRQ